MNDDAQAELDRCELFMNDPDPAVRRAYRDAYGGSVNPTDWAAIEDSENDHPYATERRPMPAKILYACATDNDGFPTCQGDRTSCGFRGVSSEIDPPPTPPVVTPVTADAEGFMMGADQPDDEDDGPPFIRAKYDGLCSACGEYHILADETMIRSDGSDGWEAGVCMVKIKTIHLDDDEKPSTVVAEMTIEEAAWIAEKTGRETGSEDATSGLYNALVGSVFNTFWSDGVDGYRRGDDE